MRTVGTCSLCGGPVAVPDFWHGILPPTPTCQRCGAEKAEPHGPVVPMKPARKPRFTPNSGGES